MTTTANARPAKVRMTLAQHRCMARLVDGWTIELDGAFDWWVRCGGLRHAVHYATQARLFAQHWIEHDPAQRAYVVTDAGRAAYANSRIS